MIGLVKSAARRLIATYVSAGYPLLPLTRLVSTPLRRIYHCSPVLRHDSRFYVKPYLLSTLHKLLVVRHPPDFSLYHGQLHFRSYGSEMSVHGYYVGEIEHHLARFIVQQLRPGFVMVDVGAHHGAHTLVVAYELRSRQWPGKVYSFEPSRENYALLEHNVVENGLSEYVELQQAAVSNVAGGQYLWVDVNENSNNVLANPGQPPAVDRAAGKARQLVQVIMLDSLYASVPGVHLIKIDVQGGEPQVLAGAERVIDRDRPILIVEAVQGWPSIQLTQQFLVGHNYQIYGVDEHGDLCEPNSARAFVSWDWVGLPK